MIEILMNLKPQQQLPQAVIRTWMDSFVLITIARRNILQRAASINFCDKTKQNKLPNLQPIEIQ